MRECGVRAGMVLRRRDLAVGHIGSVVEDVAEELDGCSPGVRRRGFGAGIAKFLSSRKERGVQGSFSLKSTK